MTTSFMCLGGHQYEIDGWRFEWHSYCGPAPIDDNGDPINEEPPPEFWEIVEKFQAMSEEERAKCFIRTGGCIEFTTAKGD